MHRSAVISADDFGNRHRAFVEAGQAAPDDAVALRSKPARIRRDNEPETPAEVALRERLQEQVLQRLAGESL